MVDIKGEANTLGAVFEGLTDRQVQVLVLVAEGLTSKEIAYELGLANRTVNQHIDAVRNQAGGMPRKHLARSFVTWNSTRDSLTRDFLTIENFDETKLDDGRQPSGNNQYLNDSLTVDQRAPWETLASWKLSEIRPSELGKLGTFIALLLGSVLILIIAILGLAFSQGLEALLR